MSFIIYYTLNVAIYCFLTLVAFIIAAFMLVKQDDDFGITGILAIITFFVTMITFCFIGDPKVEGQTFAKTFGMISAIATYVLILIQPIINSIKNIPRNIKQHKADKKSKIVEKIAQKTKNILDL